MYHCYANNYCNSNKNDGIDDESKSRNEFKNRNRNENIKNSDTCHASKEIPVPVIEIRSIEKHDIVNHNTMDYLTFCEYEYIIDHLSYDDLKSYVAIRRCGTDNGSKDNENHDFNSDLSTNCPNYSDKDTKIIRKKIFNSIIIASNVFTTIYSRMKDTDKIIHKNEKLYFGCKNDTNLANNDVNFHDDSNNGESNNGNDTDTMNTHDNDKNNNSNKTDKNNNNDSYNYDNNINSNKNKDFNNHILNSYTCGKMTLLSDKRFFHEWIQKSKLT
jgi:hypothetical protein